MNLDWLGCEMFLGNCKVNYVGVVFRISSFFKFYFMRLNVVSKLLKRLIYVYVLYFSLFKDGKVLFVVEGRVDYLVEKFIF